MSALSGTQLMTAEEFFDFVHRPENRDRIFELERGKVVEMSRPGFRHGIVRGNVTGILRNFAFSRRKGLVCSNDTGLLLERRPDTVRGPDVFFYDEIGRYSDLEIRWPDKPPTLIVEVLSPNDRWGKVTRRLTEYLNRGTPLVWLVDPEDQTVTVYHSGQQIPQVFEGTDELTGNDVLPDFRCRVADFFYLPGEETPSAGS